MADQGTSSIVVAASKADVMAVIADFARYPEWAGFIKAVEVLSTGPSGRADRAHFVIDAGILKADYTLAYTYDGDDAVRWTLVAGSLKENTGSYTLVSLDDGSTEVTYSLSVDLGTPMLGMFKRKAEKVIMDTALKELKKRVENR